MATNHAENIFSVIENDHPGVIGQVSPEPVHVDGAVAAGEQTDPGAAVGGFLSQQRQIVAVVPYTAEADITQSVNHISCVIARQVFVTIAFLRKAFLLLLTAAISKILLFYYYW